MTRLGENGWRNLLLALTALTILVFLIQALQRFTIQDDARQFLAWMPRLMDPALLRGDLLADYWQSVAPPLYRWIYEAGALLGIDPVILSRLLPVPLLALTAWAAWRVSLFLTQNPVAAFVAASALLAAVIHEDSVFSSTPRAFSAPLFLLFLDALLRDRPVRIVISLVLLAAIYPSTALVGLVMLGLSRIRLRPTPAIDFSRRSVLLVGLAGAGALAAALPLAGSTDRWGPTLTLEQARTLPNFMTVEGRSSLVSADGEIGWVCSQRMGFLPEIFLCDGSIPWAGFLNFLLFVPMLLLMWHVAIGKRRFDPGGGNYVYLIALIAAALLYAVAVALAFELHLPSRYSQRVLHMLGALAIGQIAGLWLARRLERGGARLAAFFAGLLILASFATPQPRLRQPADPGAIAAIRALPADTRIAGVAGDLDFVPALAGRQVLATAEHGIPYHRGYFAQVEDRLAASLAAVSTSDVGELRAILREQRIDILAVDRKILEERRLPESYAGVAADAYARASAALTLRPPAIAASAERCARYRGSHLVLLDAACLQGGR